MKLLFLLDKTVSGHMWHTYTYLWWWFILYFVDSPCSWSDWWHCIDWPAASSDLEDCHFNSWSQRICEVWKGTCHVRLEQG